MASRQISQVLLGPEAPAEGSSCFRVRPLLARCARSPGVFRCAAVLPAVFRCFLERLTPPGAHSKAFGTPFWPPGCLPEPPLGRQPGEEPPRAPQKRPESPPRAAKSAPRGPKQPQATRSFIFDRFGSPFQARFWEPGSLKKQQKVSYCRQKSRFSRFCARGPKKTKK